MSPRHIGTLVIVSLLLSGPVPAQPEELIYVSQFSPARYHAFQFDGTQYIRRDLALASPLTYFDAGTNPAGDLMATSHLMVTTSTAQNLAVQVVDPFTAAELGRVKTTVLLANAILSNDGSLAYLGGNPGAAGNALLSIVDLRGASPTFLSEIATVDLGTPGGRPALAVSTDGLTLLVAVPTSALAMRIYDLTDAVAPALLHAVNLPIVGPAAQAITSFRYAVLGGQPYLIGTRSHLFLLAVRPDRSVDTAVWIQSQAASGSARHMVDAVVFDDPGGAQAFVVADVYDDATAEVTEQEELLVVDLTAPLADDPAGTRVTRAVTVSTPGSFDFDRVRLSSSGAHVHVLSRGESAESSVLYAFDRAALVAGGPPLLASIDLDPDGTPAFAAGILLREELTPVPGASLDAASVDGGLLINDAPRTITLTGSGLGDVRHAFAGPEGLTLGPITATSVSATSAAGIPAGNPPVVVVDGAGATARVDGLAVVNPAGYQPAHVVYSASFAQDTISVINASTQTEVVSTFRTGPTPARLAVSRDGRLLFVSDFIRGTVSVHAILADPERGYGWNEEIARLNVGGNPQALVQNPAGTRLYVTTLDANVAVIDTSVSPPVVIDTDGDAGTTDEGLEPGITRIKISPFPVAFGEYNVRGLALSADGQWLYAARTRDPHILAIFVGDDVVTDADKNAVSLPNPPGGGRGDGLVLHGSRLYFGNASDSQVRVFEVSGPSLVPAVPAALALPGPSTRQLAVSPDGRFVYVASRTTATVHIFDVGTGALEAVLDTGLFTDVIVVSPDSQFAYVAVGERDSVLSIDARAGSPTLHQVVARTGGGVQVGGLAVSAGVETPAGSNVVVEPAKGVVLTLASVRSLGQTSATASNVSALPLPAGFSAKGRPVFHRIRSTAHGRGRGRVKVCLAYDDSGLSRAEESALRLLQQQGTTLVDRTLSVNTRANEVCATLSLAARDQLESGHAVECALLMKDAIVRASRRRRAEKRPPAPDAGAGATASRA